MKLGDNLRWIPAASVGASHVDYLGIALLIASILVTLLVFVLVVYFGLKYRRRNEDEVPEEHHSSIKLEISWTVATFIGFMAFFFWGAKLFIEEKRPPQNAMEINVVGKQWMWKIQHPEGAREIDELHVPVGVPVKLIMTSQDVIHSFGLPAFRVTQDVIPGSYSTEWFTADRVGEYLLVCREFCGTLHSQMIGKVVVMRPEEYQAWLAGTLPNESPVAVGRKLFLSYGCAQCHGQTAPTLAGLYGREVKLDDGRTVIADENYLRESIIDPAAKVVAGYSRLMPSYRNQLSEEQIFALVDYIKSLGAVVNDSGKETNRTDTAAPATRPVNGYSPLRVPDMPPARQPAPGVEEITPKVGNDRRTVQ